MEYLSFRVEENRVYFRITILVLICLLLLHGTRNLYYDGDEKGKQNWRHSKEEMSFFDAQVYDIKDHITWTFCYTTRAVIIIDRDKTEQPIKGWKDLLDCSCKIGIGDKDPEQRLLLSAVAYGLDGEKFHIGTAIDLLKNCKGGIECENAQNCDVIIGFEDYGEKLIAEGRNLAIVIPQEGTLTFEKGMASYCDTKTTETVFEKATLSDYTHLLKESEDVSSRFRREVLNVRKYTSADSYEHILSAVFFSILCIICLGCLLNRAMLKVVRLIIILSIGGLVLWTLLRLFKWQLDDGRLERYCWYGYYLFELGLPLLIVWISLVMDREEESKKLPRCMYFLILLNGILLGLVFTNDWHKKVFYYEGNNWTGKYTYGVLFYVLLSVILLECLLGSILLLRKAQREIKYQGLMFLILTYALFGVYEVGYIMEIDLFHQGDNMITLGIFVILLLMSITYTGLVPINRRYVELFQNSTLQMQMVNKEGKVILHSMGTEVVDQSIIDKLRNYENPVNVNEDTVVHGKYLADGIFIWCEDLSEWNQLYGQLKEAIEKLEKSYLYLEKEEKIRREYVSIEEKRRLIEILDEEIGEQMQKLMKMVDQLQKGQNRQEEIIQIILLLCYIKRRCNLIFRERETSFLPAAELMVYIDEMSEFCRYGNIRVLTACQRKGEIKVRQATLLYDFFYYGIEWAYMNGCTCIIEQLLGEGEKLELRIMMDKSAPFEIKKDLKDKIHEAAGEILLKDLEDTIGITVIFAKGAEYD